MDNMANGYLRLVHQIQAHLSPPPPVLIQVEEKREVGGEIPKSPVIEDEISQSSEDGTQPRIGFVDLFRRSLQFECLGMRVSNPPDSASGHLSCGSGRTKCIPTLLHSATKLRQ